MLSVPSSPVSMLGRATLVLDAFGTHGRALTLGQVCARTQLPRSTAYRILQQLVQFQWVTHTGTGYVLGQRVRRWGAGDTGWTRLRAGAAPVLHRLLLDTSGVVHLGVLDGGELVLVDKIGGRFATAVPSRVGDRFAAHRCGLGRAALAELVPEDAEARIAAVDRNADLGEVHAQLAHIRRQGVAFADNEYGTDLAEVAAPAGGAAAIGVVSTDSGALQRIAPRVVVAATEIRSELD